MPKEIKIEADLNQYCTVLEKTLASYNRYFEYKIDPYCNKDKRRNINKKHYPFIPAYFNMGLIVVLSNLLKRLKNETPSPYRFLDCGCGIGNVMMLANAIGFNAEGIEYDGMTYRIAKEITGRLTGDKRVSIMRGDITKFRGYKNYDVIYFYIPISEHEKMQLFMDRLKEKTRVGAYIVSYTWGTVQVDDRVKGVTLKRGKNLDRKIHDSISSISVFQKIKK